jgi:2,4-dienoyl-CoA reductase-like NADH-dependent reductase (Old Yellow Enzyme family)
VSDLFSEAPLGPIGLGNRVIKAATYEGMSPRGEASEALVAFHRRLAEGGVGLTTVAYCAVSPEGRTFADQLWLNDASRHRLETLTSEVHATGGKASLQLSHAGMFSKLRGRGGRVPRGPSLLFNAYGVSAGLPYARAMTRADIAQVVEDFADAAKSARELGFDAVEIHLGHGYLLSQFLSPAFNRRRDAWGGSLENRLRFPLEVLARVRGAVGEDLAVIAKTNLDDGLDDGLHIDEAVEIAAAIEASGDADLLVPSGGTTSRSAFYLLRGGLPLAEMADAQDDALSAMGMRLLGRALVKAYPFSEAFFKPLAERVRARVRMPVALLGGLVSRQNLVEARAAGFDFVVLGRALIADPDLVRRMERGELERTRCDACNLCVAEMDRGGVRCVLDDRGT